MQSGLLLQEILRRQQLEYILVDSDLRIRESTPGAGRYASRQGKALVGQSILRVFDIFSGMQPDLQNTLQNGSPLLLEKIQTSHPGAENHYFSVHILPYEQSLLVLFADVTREAALEQRITQQRNQLNLLTNQLDALLHRFIPSRVADRVMLRPQDVQLGGEERDVSILFADVRGFTAISEMLPASSLLQVLNAHFAVCGEVIGRFGGEVTNYGGDMLMAIFNGHGDQPEHPRAAVQAALEMQAAFANPQPNLSEGMPFLLQFGVGVNTGMAVVGYLGYQTRFEYTAIGENVNLAARLCGLARSGEALATEQTQARAAGLRFAPLQSARLKGFRASIRMSEALP